MPRFRPSAASRAAARCCSSTAARVTSERRVGPSATFADPATFEGIDVARGPGSVAYGSDALGGVISVRTRRAEPGSPLQIRGSGTLGGGVPDRRGVLEALEGPDSRRRPRSRRMGARPTTGTAPKTTKILNSGWKDRGFLARVDHQVGKGMLSVGLAERLRQATSSGRATTRTRSASTTPTRIRTASPVSYELAQRRRVPADGRHRHSSARSSSGRIRTASPRRRPGAASSAPTSRPTTSMSRATQRRAVGPARLEFGVDVNGRYGLEALDMRPAYNLAGAVTSDVNNVSIDNAHRTDTGAYVQADMRRREAGPAVGRRCAATTSPPRTPAVSSAIDRHDNGAFSGFAAGTVGPFSGLSFTGQVSRGFRDPTLSDRYFRGPSGRGFITGNPDLEPETSLQYDLASSLCDGADPAGRLFLPLHDRRSRRALSTQTDFFFFRNRGSARVRGFEFEARTDAAVRTSPSKSAPTSDAARRSMTTPTSTTSRPTRSRCWCGRTSANGRSRQMRAAFLADDDRPGPERSRGARGDADRSRRRMAASREIPRAARHRPQPARRRLLREPGSALGIGAGPFGQRYARVSVLRTRQSLIPHR